MWWPEVQGDMALPPRRLSLIPAHLIPRRYAQINDDGANF
jgi:hypothetical protein